MKCKQVYSQTPSSGNIAEGVTFCPVLSRTVSRFGWDILWGLQFLTLSCNERAYVGWGDIWQRGGRPEGLIPGTPGWGRARPPLRVPHGHGLPQGRTCWGPAWVELRSRGAKTREERCVQLQGVFPCFTLSREFFSLGPRCVRAVPGAAPALRCAGRAGLASCSDTALGSGTAVLSLPWG